MSDENAVGETFELSGINAILPAEKSSSSNLLIVPHLANSLKERYMILKRLVKLVKPEALVMTAANETLAASFLKIRVFTPLLILERRYDDVPTTALKCEKEIG